MCITDNRCYIRCAYIYVHNYGRTISCLYFHMSNVLFIPSTVQSHKFCSAHSVNGSTPRCSRRRSVFVTFLWDAPKPTCGSIWRYATQKMINRMKQIQHKSEKNMNDYIEACFVEHVGEVMLYDWLEELQQRLHEDGMLS